MTRYNRFRAALIALLSLCLGGTVQGITTQSREQYPVSRLIGDTTVVTWEMDHTFYWSHFLMISGIAFIVIAVFIYILDGLGWL